MNIQQAIKVEKSFGVNVRGCALSILKQMKEEEDLPSLEDLANAWDDHGNDVLYHEFLGTNGHMSRKQSTILQESVRELIDDMIHDVESWEELQALLSRKE